MDYSIKLTNQETDGLRQTVAETWKAGVEWAQATEIKEKDALSDYYGRMLRQIETQAQKIAEQAFAAARRCPPLN